MLGYKALRWVTKDLRIRIQSKTKERRFGAHEGAGTRSKVRKAAREGMGRFVADPLSYTCFAGTRTTYTQFNVRLEYEANRK
jgi:hypothetical protein